MSVIRRRFAQNLKKIRKSQMTQEVLAEKLNISVRYIQKLEGKDTPNVQLDTLESLAKALKVEVTEFFMKKTKSKN